MTGLERLRTCLNHEEADHVPYDLAGTTVTSISDIAFERAMKMRDISPEWDESKVVDLVSQIIIPPEETLQKLKSDTRRMGAPRLLDTERNLKKEGDRSWFNDQYNCTWEMIKGKDFYFNQTFHPLEEYDELPEALNHLTIPDLEPYRQSLYADFNRQRADVTDSALIADRNCAGLTEMSLRLRGYEKCYMDMALYPSEMRSFMEAFADHKIQYWDIMGDYIIENGLQDQVPVVAECDDMGTQQSLLVSKEMMNELIFPPMKRYLTFIKKKMPWVKIFFHSCGAIREILPEMIDAGVDILNPVQYTATGMDLKELKRDFGKDLTFWGGGIDTQGVLSNGTPDQVRDEVKRNLDILAPGGGYVFVPVHNMQEDVPAENFWAMWDTWNEFGKY